MDSELYSFCGAWLNMLHISNFLAGLEFRGGKSKSEHFINIISSDNFSWFICVQARLILLCVRRTAVALVVLCMCLSCGICSILVETGTATRIQYGRHCSCCHVAATFNVRSAFNCCLLQSSEFRMEMDFHADWRPN